MTVELLSQEYALQRIKGIAKTGQVANGYIFAGPEKCGKTTAAKLFFSILNCTNDPAPCGHCLNCQKIKNGTAVDFYILEPDGQNIKIEQIRELKKYVQFGPHEARYLTVCIQQAEKFSTESANSFLKLLEEPPANVFFILETVSTERLLKTIVSRCQTINFSQLPEEALLTIIKKNYPLPEEQIKRAAALSGGLLKNTEFYLENQALAETTIAFSREVKKKTFNEIVFLVDEITAKKNLGTEKEKISALLELLGQEARNNYNLSAAAVIIEYLQLLQRNINVKLALENMFLKLKENHNLPKTI